MGAEAPLSSPPNALAGLSFQGAVRPAAMPAGVVSRTRFDRERAARREAERLLEAKSRELYEVNQALRRQAEDLEQAVRDRTADLETARLQAEAANAAKSHFLAAMSHEIRTPLNGVLGLAEALRDSALNSEQAQILDLILGSGDVLLTVINDILDLSKVEAGRIDIEQVPFDLSAVVTAIEQTYGLIAREKGLAFGFDASGVAHRWLRGDPTRLRQVLTNLISNAVKFTGAGSVGVTLSLATVPGSDGSGAILSAAVADTGPGIPPDRLPNLFEPYSQAGSDIARRFGGTGLGLQLSRKFCRLMGGDLTVTSRLGAGSVFTATMRVVPDLAPVQDERENFKAVFARFAKQRNPRVLVADDNATNRAVLRHQLGQFECRLAFAATGREAYDLWRRDGADVILMDVQMPDMDGIEATGAIRTHEFASGCAATPIVAMSANAMNHQAQVYLGAGMDAVVTKPVNLQHLLATMTDLLQGRGGKGVQGR